MVARVDFEAEVALALRFLLIPGVRPAFDAVDIAEAGGVIEESIEEEEVGGVTKMFEAGEVPANEHPDTSSIF